MQSSPSQISHLSCLLLHPQAQPNIALAFGLVIAAGACTVLGALLVFFSNLANPKWLSGSLGASAGVMM
jgi:ZIP family zinc transporter